MKNRVMAMLLGLTISAPLWAVGPGDVSAGKEKSQTCAACHGADGNSPSDMYPKLAGQHAGYIAKQLAAFKNGDRENELMSPMAANLSEQDMADLGAYYADQEIEPGATNEDLLELGKQIYRAGNPESGVPACMACHGPTGAGVPAANWPALSGQYSAYTEKQLHDFASGDRANSLNGMMGDIASKMTDEEIEAVSSYVSGLH